MPQKKQTDTERMNKLRRRLEIPIPPELLKNIGGVGDIELDADDEKILDAAWAKEAERSEKMEQEAT